MAGKEMRRSVALFLIVAAFAGGLAAGMAIGSWDNVSRTTRETAADVRSGAQEQWEAVKEEGKEAAAEAKEGSASLGQRIQKAWQVLTE